MHELIIVEFFTAKYDTQTFSSKRFWPLGSLFHLLHSYFALSDLTFFSDFKALMAMGCFAPHTKLSETSTVLVDSRVAPSLHPSCLVNKLVFNPQPEADIFLGTK